MYFLNISGDSRIKYFHSRCVCEVLESGLVKTTVVFKSEPKIISSFLPGSVEHNKVKPISIKIMFGKAQLDHKIRLI